MILLGLLLIALGLLLRQHQKERPHKRRRTLGVAAHPSYRPEFIALIVDDVLKSLAALLVVSGLTVIALAFELLLTVAIFLALFGWILLDSYWR